MSELSQELREAAKRIRADASWPSEELSFAVAGLLDEVAAASHSSSPAWVVESAALKVARAYLTAGES